MITSTFIMLCNNTNFSSAVFLVLVAAIISIGSAAPSEAVAMDDDDSSFLDHASDRALTVAEVNTKIGNQLKQMQTINNSTTVQTRLTPYLQVEYKNQYNWLVYVAQNFKPSKENAFIDYSGKGFTGNVIVGAWTVYWAATPIAPTDSQPIIANDAAAKSQLSKCSSSSTIKNPLTASMTYTCLKKSPPVTSGRKPVAQFVFLSPDRSPNFSVGNSQGMKAIIIIIKTDVYWGCCPPWIAAITTIWIIW